MRISGTAAAISTACIALAFSQPATAAEEDAWKFEATPYMLASGMKGTVGVRGYKSDADISFGDIMDALDFGFMGVFTAQKGPWTFDLEGVYMKLKDSGSEGVQNFV